MDYIKIIKEILESDFTGTVAWICPSCINAILDDEEQGTQIDFGTIRVLDEKFHRCDMADYRHKGDHAA